MKTAIVVIVFIIGVAVALGSTFSHSGIFHSYEGLLTGNSQQR
jgi:hypothetical protein